MRAAAAQAATLRKADNYRRKLQLLEAKTPACEGLDREGIERDGRSIVGWDIQVQEYRTRQAMQLWMQHEWLQLIGLEGSARVISQEEAAGAARARRGF